MPRILWNMAQDGLVFNWCAKVSKKSKTPINATIIAIVVAASLAGLLKLAILVDIMSIGTLAAYALVALCVLVLRYRPDDYDLVQKQGPTLEQGEWSTKLIYGVSFWYLIAGIVMSKCSIWFKDTLEISTISTIWWTFAASMLILSAYAIYELKKIPESTKSVSFKVPLLPYFPLLNLAINLYLMAALELMIWVQLCFWLAIGFGIYFFYGVKHSSENPEVKQGLLSAVEVKEKEAGEA